MHLNRALLGNTLYLAFIHGVVLVEVIGLLSVTPSARADPIVGHDLYTLTVPSGTTLFTFGSPSKPQFISNNPMSSDHFVGYAGATTSTERALLWNGMGTPTSLHPSGYSDSFAFGVSGNQQVGRATGPNPGVQQHAMIWNGSNVGVDINPVGLAYSTAYGTDGTHQVGLGSAFNGAPVHALLWNGTNVATDLNPSGFDYSQADYVRGGQEVGYGYITAFPSNGNNHALLWNGTGPAIDLNPTGIVRSAAVSTDGTHQVGYGGAFFPSGFTDHALLWSGTKSAVDLHPAGFDVSAARDVNGDWQVGVASIANVQNSDIAQFDAMLWHGSAGSAINLQQYLPASLVSSQALSIVGSTVYGYATDADNNIHIVSWTNAIPEPTLLSPLAIATLGLLGRRQSRRPD